MNIILFLIKPSFIHDITLFKSIWSLPIGLLLRSLFRYNPYFCINIILICLRKCTLTLYWLIWIRGLWCWYLLYLLILKLIIILIWSKYWGYLLRRRNKPRLLRSLLLRISFIYVVCWIKAKGSIWITIL